MSVTQNVLIGKSRKSMGNATFTTWKGLNVLKSKPVSVANPQTDKQLAQRSALRQLVSMFRANRGAIEAGFKSKAIKMSAFNAFTSYNLKNGFNLSSPPDADFSPTNFSFSRGTIETTAIATAVIDASAHTLTITWAPSPLSAGQSNSDTVGWGVVNTTAANEMESGTTTDVRSAGTATITLANTYTAGDTCIVYLFFKSATDNAVSDSVNTSVTVVA